MTGSAQTLSSLVHHDCDLQAHHNHVVHSTSQRQRLAEREKRKNSAVSFFFTEVKRVFSELIRLKRNGITLSGLVLADFRLNGIHAEETRYI